MGKSSVIRTAMDRSKAVRSLVMLSGWSRRPFTGPLPAAHKSMVGPQRLLKRLPCSRRRIQSWRGNGKVHGIHDGDTDVYGSPDGDEDEKAIIAKVRSMTIPGMCTVICDCERKTT